MGLWDLFSNQKNNQESGNKSSLYYSLKEKFSDKEESTLIKVTGIAGLFARVAYVDFELHQDEKAHMLKALTEMTDFDDSEVQLIVELAIEHVKELAGLENHKLVYSLKEVLDQNARYQVVEALFYLAASDGVVENVESEEIRIIVKGFDLSDRHFIAARAKVSDKLKALQI